MKNLLEEQFSKIFDSDHASHCVKYCQRSGNFSFHDDKACKQCIPFFSENCEHQTFLVHSDAVVEILDIEDFLNSFTSLQGERCDCLLYDASKIAFLDMYCGMSQYVEIHITDGKYVIGKKTKVRQQIEATVNRLYEITDIKNYIESKTERYGIMGYRAKDEEIFRNVPKKISSSVNKFLRIKKILQERRLSLPMRHGFKFIVVAYPSRYLW